MADEEKDGDEERLRNKKMKHVKKIRKEDNAKEKGEKRWRKEE